MSELDDWEDASESGMRVVLRLGPDFEEAAFTLPAVPRVGDRITLHDDHPETGSVRVRYYRVRDVQWPLSVKPSWPPMVNVSCDPLPTPARVSISRDELWVALGIDPDRISREEFEAYMDAYDQAVSAGPVRPGEETT